MIRAVKSLRQVVVHSMQCEVAVRGTHKALARRRVSSTRYTRDSREQNVSLQEQGDIPDSLVPWARCVTGSIRVAREDSAVSAARANTSRSSELFLSDCRFPKLPSSRVDRRCVKSCTEARRTPRHPLAATRVQRRCAQPRCRRRLVPPSVRDGSQTRNEEATRFRRSPGAPDAARRSHLSLSRSRSRSLSLSSSCAGYTDSVCAARASPCVIAGIASRGGVRAARARPRVAKSDLVVGPFRV